jgi:outer membrane protein OmpA-like peptidoglycan-associated protein/YHS domain-containing protein
MKHLIRLLFILLPFYTFAQKDIPSKAKDFHTKGLMAYYQKQWDQTEEYERKAIDAAPNWMEPYALLADMYRYLKEYKNGIELFQKYISNNPEDFGGYLNLSDFHQLNGDYGLAAADIQEMLKHKVPEKNLAFAKQRISDMNRLQNLKDHPVDFKPENVGPGINTVRDEYMPTFTVDGQTMYFTRKKVVDSFKSFRGDFYEYKINEDLMMSKLANGQWQTATDMPGQVDTKDNEGAMAVAPDGSYLVFTGCERPDGMGSCDLYIAFLIDGKWTKPVNMGDPVNTRYKETQPSISYDGRTIYFASNRPSSMGGLDIWKTTRDDNWNFSKPVNLGPVINTKLDDQVPFIHPDNHTLYFCSHGHLNFGENDIFYAHRLSDSTWDSAVNIGYPINTSGDEPGLVVDRTGDYAYYNTTGGNSYGGLDIFRFKLPKAAKPAPVTYLQGKVFDAVTKKPVKAYFELVNLETLKTAIGTYTSEDGQFLEPLPAGVDYMVNVSAKGYLFYSENIPLKNYNHTEPYVEEIGLKPIKVGEKIALRNIFFNTDAYTLQDKSRAELQRLADFLKDNPTLRIEISGHTDNTGNAAHNMELSKNRAKSVYDYLINLGIPASRLTYQGYGSTQPVAPNTTEEGKAQNRRTEVKIIP